MAENGVATVGRPVGIVDRQGRQFEIGRSFEKQVMGKVGIVRSQELELASGRPIDRGKWGIIVGRIRGRAELKFVRVEVFDPAFVVAAYGKARCGRIVAHAGRIGAGRKGVFQGDRAVADGKQGDRGGVLEGDDRPKAIVADGDLQRKTGEVDGLHDRIRLQRDDLQLVVEGSGQQGQFAARMDGQIAAQAEVGPTDAHIPHVDHLLEETVRTVDGDDPDHVRRAGVEHVGARTVGVHADEVGIAAAAARNLHEFEGLQVDHGYLIVGA